jgi:3-oxoacyl-[acyl-carrier-protein] synthase II
MRRIVVTGMGAVTPLAADVEASWSRLLAGRSGIRRLPDDVVGDLPAKIGGTVPSPEEEPDAGFDPDGVLAPKEQRKVFGSPLWARSCQGARPSRWAPSRKRALARLRSSRRRRRNRHNGCMRVVDLRGVAAYHLYGSVP